MDIMKNEKLKNMTGCEKYRRYYVSWLLMEND